MITDDTAAGRGAQGPARVPFVPSHRLATRGERDALGEGACPRTSNHRRLYRLPWSLPDNAIAWLEPTAKCNLACEGCYRANVNAHKSLAEVAADLDVFARYRTADGISIAGGDPLTHPEIVDVAVLPSQQAPVGRRIGTPALQPCNLPLRTPESPGTFPTTSLDGAKHWADETTTDHDPPRRAMANELESLRRLLADRYRVERELGRGGMATVYLAHDPRHDRAVALKVLQPALAAALGAERFLREITLAARLDHPHIIPLLDSGEAGGFLYYVMPYVQGESLRDRLNRERQLPVEDALQIARETADALNHAHSLGIVHRDVKPENILLAGSHARLADFGIARAVTAAGGESLTATGVAIGTPAYMSPEQASGEGGVDARTDVYSLGCVLYEMLVGQPPYTGATAEAILARKYFDAPGSIRSVRSTVAREVEAAIIKALAKVPADRYSTAWQFAQALERVRDTPVAPAPATRRFPTRRVVLASVGVVLALAATWWGGTRRQPVVSPLGSLAVLPFANVSGDPEQDYFASGMTEELISRLAGVPGLTVKSRTSVRRYHESDDPLPRIAAILGVDALVEGSLSRSTDAVRIRVRLVQARPERTVWSRTYDRDLNDALALQSEVARAIAREIGAVVTPEHERRMARVAALDPIAAEAYFKGRFYWNRRTADDLLRAIRHFEQAIAVDPKYGRAYAGLADCYVLLGYGMMSVLRPLDALPKARAAARQALEIQDDLVEAQTSLAYAETYEWNWEAAERGFERAIALDRGYGTVADHCRGGRLDAPFRAPARGGRRPGAQGPRAGTRLRDRPLAARRCLRMARPPR